MGLKGLLIACFRVSALVGAQTIPRDTILNILSTYPQLSGLSTLVNSLPLLVQQFNTADNFTFLAPTNDAISLWLATNRSSDYIQATLQYHLLSGTVPSASITSSPIFIPTALTNHSYCNVTGGQRLKATSNGGHLLFGSALQTTSNALSTDTIAFGGIIHTIDKVLELPIGPGRTIAAENLSYFIAIAEKGGYLSGEARPFVDAYFSRPDTTYFIFNSAKALAHFNGSTLSLNAATLLNSSGYTLAPRVIYSTALVNGTQIMTVLGLPLLVTVQDGDTYINNAKVTSRDNFISNGVFHVIDDIIDPWNITGPSSSTNTSEARPPMHLSTGAKSGIGVGMSVGVLAVAAALIFIYRRKRSSSSGVDRNSNTWRDNRKPGDLTELSAKSCHELPELPTTESAVELPAEYGFHQEIGKAF